MKIIWGKDAKGQLYVEWEQVAGIYKRAWIQRKDPADDKNWANVPDGRYLNVVRVNGPGKGPAGNATDFPIFNSKIPDRQVLTAFVYSICAITGISLDAEPIEEGTPDLTTEDFRVAIDELLAQASQQGVKHIDVKSGELHRNLGGYPGPNHRMPICCSVMKSAMHGKDEIINAPPSGQGASLTIRYMLPRR